MASTTTTTSGAIPALKLNDGNEMPMLAYGFGTANIFGKDDDISKLTAMAIKNGYYHLDSAEAYGNETGVGAGIKASGVPREKLYVVTKVVGTKGQDVRAALASSLAKLGVDYLDLYLVHIPFGAGSAAELQRLWAEMEAVQASGKARSIGVSNFEQADVEVVLQTAKTVPAVNQIEYHPYLQHGDLVPYLRSKNIAVAAYSALTALTSARPGPVDGTYAELAQKYGVAEGEVALRWVLDQDIVAITTSKSEERLQGYLRTLPSFKLTDEEIKRISEVGKQKHYQGPGEAYMRAKYCS
ncbi:Aldo/keto reductase [Annulohypoxylon truncatum]|uniref:Aldo/keto reductase n=1 Tax=Annulohypoxylon truncatum TaxID=327061 RepID=UPI0020078025|nr:Aldo/keto reductase [Annulohypoxylon truncatum]KAI1207970.1 Aldo/keto reductase [Annulohypoxylon truncatum]